MMMIIVQNETESPCQSFRILSVRPKPEPESKGILKKAMESLEGYQNKPIFPISNSMSSSLSSLAAGTPPRCQSPAVTSSGTLPSIPSTPTSHSPLLPHRPLVRTKSTESTGKPRKSCLKDRRRSELEELDDGLKILFPTEISGDKPRIGRSKSRPTLTFSSPIDDMTPAASPGIEGAVFFGDNDMVYHTVHGGKKSRIITASRRAEPFSKIVRRAVKTPGHEGFQGTNGTAKANKGVKSGGAVSHVSGHTKKKG